MTDGGDTNDLWAATRPGQAASNPIDPPDPTEVIPVVPGGGAASGGAAGGPPPPAPPGPPGSEPPDGNDPDARPAWLIPAVAGLAVLLVLGLTLALVLNNGTDSPDVSESTVAPPTSATATTETPATEPLPTEPPATEPPPSEPPQTDPPATDPPPTQPPTTEPPATDPAITDPPSTEPPPTDVPVSTSPDPTLPDPGFAQIGNETVPIDKNCFVVPLAPNTAHYQVRSHIITTSAGRVVIDRWYDEGGVDGLDVWFVGPDERAEATAVEDRGESIFASAEIRGTTIQIVLNPLPEQEGDCFETVTASTTDIDEFPFTQAVLDVCTVGDGPSYIVVALLSDQSRLTARDDGQGLADLIYEAPRDEDPYRDPLASSFNEDAGRIYTGLVERDGATQEVLAFLGVPALRTCEPSEIPT